MGAILGDGNFRYEVVDSWAQLPPGMTCGDVGGIGIDRHDNVYVFNRGPHPMLVFDRDGKFLRTWGEGMFPRAHGVHMGPDDTIYLTDDGDHTVRKCTLDGKVLLTIGIPGRPSKFLGGQPFNRCTHTTLSPRGDIYVTDGYGNAKVHKFSPDGKLLKSWGDFGIDPGQFNIVHNICSDADGWLYVADRENHRIQVFDGEGKYETQWNFLHRPCGVCMSQGAQPFCYVGELGPSFPLTRDFPNLGPRVSITDIKGNVLARLGKNHAGEGDGQFVAPHGMAVDSRGDIYVGEVANTFWPQVYPDRKPEHTLRTLQKLRKVA
ncbi:MAG: hypothetical protein J0H17_10305 [Rhizobiales bacterium]|jgi:DNA-binding beta-propeller fold protein YncE|nr:hypothetical protein [Hyphomicrobiales bacterium]